MSHQPFAVFRRTEPPRIVSCPHLRELLEQDWAPAIDRRQLEAAIDELENATRCYEQSRSDFEQKSSRLHDSLNRYDGELERVMAGADDLERLFERTGALESASEEFRGALHDRGDAKMAAQHAMQRIALLLAKIDVESLGDPARESFLRADAELSLWTGRLSVGQAPVAYSMLPAARWRRIA